MVDTKYVRGATKLKARIATLRRNLDLPGLMEETKTLLLRRTMQRFDAEVDPDYKPWADLKPSTLKRKKSHGHGSAKKLVESRDMRGAIKVIRGGAGTTFTNTGAGFRIGIEDEDIAEYGRVQNRGKKGLVARRFLGIGARDVKSVDNLLRRRAVQLGVL